NSSVKAARWDGAWRAVTRFPAGNVGTDVWAERLQLLGPTAESGIASVVPRLTPVLSEALRSLTGSPPHVVSARQPLPFRLAYATPETLGTDRLAAAVAAHSLAEGRPVVALDAGSAVTTEVVTDEPAYLGGAILPGPDLLRRALVRDTDQLPDIPWPNQVAAIGDSTRTAIQAGTGVMALDGVHGLLRRTIDDLGGDALVIATGGWGPWFAERIALITRVEPHLVLDGIRQLAIASGRRG
ncbi:MAG: type III pantothenate kinase, partial [Bacteroidota bacterium]